MMKTLKLVLTSVTMFAVLIAGDESRIGTSGGNQVLVPVGARGIALAGSERVYSSGLESIYWNPADLPDLKVQRFLLVAWTCLMIWESIILAPQVILTN